MGDRRRGPRLPSPAAFASNVYTFDAANTVSTGTSATLANVYGCLVYDDTTADHGICYNYFGGTN